MVRRLSALLIAFATLGAGCGDSRITEPPQASATNSSSFVVDGTAKPAVSQSPAPSESAAPLVATVAIRESIRGPSPFGAQDLVGDGHGQAWISFSSRRRGEVQSIDLATGQPIFHTRTGWSPEHLALGDGWLWVAEGIGDGSHDPADPDQNRVEILSADNGKIEGTAPVRLPGILAASGDRAWVNTTDSTLLELEAPSGRRIARLTLSAEPRSAAFVAPEIVVLTTGPGSSAAESVVIVDATSDRVLAAIPSTDVLGPVTTSAIGAELVARDPQTGDLRWTLVDRSSERLVELGPLLSNTDVTGVAVRADGGLAWAYTTDRSAYAFDPRSGTATTAEVDLAIGTDDPVAIVAVSDGAWILTTHELLKLTIESN